MTIPSDSAPSRQQVSHDPSLCKTQVFIDRDVEILRCEEDKPCPYKMYYNNMVICDCRKGSGNEHH